MAETVDTQVPTESTLSSSEVKRYLHKDVQKEAALAAVAATYEERFPRMYTYNGEFARCFEAIRDEEGKAKFTEETLETAKALQPAIDYYSNVLPSEFLLLPFFSDKNGRSAHFGPLPPVADSDVHRFQNGLYRLQSMYEIVRRDISSVGIHYGLDRKTVRPYSRLQLNQAKMLHEMFVYRMFQVCDKHLDDIERRKFRPDPAARKPRDMVIIRGIVCHGLKFMHEFETQTTYKGREELIRKITKRAHWGEPDFWEGPTELSEDQSSAEQPSEEKLSEEQPSEERPSEDQLLEELCAIQRTFDNLLGELPERYDEVIKFEEWAKRARQEYKSGHIHPAGDN
ncbi:unnamed protein product [Clonostachys chloroleuca]|uniref:Uncharacterized protein n=1 Tax=Clonostachys chloroleuca TaxID=1926264 RepID=A0AA35LQH4_9HYPO|nr:unnamed protein product [Clonostachys chloroleuca]